MYISTRGPPRDHPSWAGQAHASTTVSKFFSTFLARGRPELGSSSVCARSITKVMVSHLCFSRDNKQGNDGSEAHDAYYLVLPTRNIAQQNSESAEAYIDFSGDRDINVRAFPFQYQQRLSESLNRAVSRSMFLPLKQNSRERRKLGFVSASQSG